MGNPMALVNTSGKMVVYIMVNSKKVSSMVKANGRSCKIHRIAISMRESTQMIKRMDMEFSLGKVGMYTKETMLMMREMDLEKCFGLMALAIKESGRKEYNMAMGRWSFLIKVSKKACLRIMYM